MKRVQNRCDRDEMRDSIIRDADHSQVASLCTCDEVQLIASLDAIMVQSILILQKSVSIRKHKLSNVRAFPEGFSATALNI